MMDVSIINSYFEDDGVLDQQAIINYKIDIDEKKEEIKQLLNSNIIRDVNMVIKFSENIELRDFTIEYINDNYLENYFDAGEFDNKRDAIKFYFLLRYKILLNYVSLYNKQFNEYSLEMLVKNENELIDLYKFILSMAVKHKQEKYHQYLFNLLCNYSIREFWTKFLKNYIVDFYVHLIV